MQGKGVKRKPKTHQSHKFPLQKQKKNKQTKKPTKNTQIQIQVLFTNVGDLGGRVELEGVREKGR